MVKSEKVYMIYICVGFIFWGRKTKKFGSFIYFDSLPSGRFDYYVYYGLEESSERYPSVGADFLLLQLSFVPVNSFRLRIEARY